MREISAGIIIYRKTIEGPRFLILYHGRGYWNFPKGKIQSEEKSWQAAVREIHEETGLRLSDLKFKKDFKVYEKFVFWRRLENKNVKIFKIVIFYLAETAKIDVRISSEHEGYAWFTYREALKILSRHKDSQRVLIQAYEFLRRKNIQNR
mgnify:CR=1 FL=1